MDTRTGEIAEYAKLIKRTEEEADKGGEKLFPNPQDITPLSDKEYKMLTNIDEGKRPAHLAWIRHSNNTLPPKLMFLAGFEAARKMMGDK